MWIDSYKNSSPETNFVCLCDITYVPRQRDGYDAYYDRKAARENASNCIIS